MIPFKDGLVIKSLVMLYLAFIHLRSESKSFGIFPLEMLKVEQSDGHCTESVGCNGDYIHDAVFLQETTALTAMRQTVQILHKMKSVILSTILDQYPQCHLGVCEVYDAAVPL